jgi:tripartite-type tricarboxylate transporter receptor subunit TctC
VLRMLMSSITLGVVVAGSPVKAASYPEGPVQVVVPYGPGGGVDTFTRPLTAALSEQTSQSFLVQNKPGGGGTIGVRIVARAPADGYMLLSGGVHQAMAESIYPNRGYVMDKDFVPLALTALVPNVVIVNKETPFQTLTDFINYAKKHPNELNYCSSGVGTAQHLVAEMFMEATGIKMTHVPYTGTAAALSDLIGGHCQVMFDGLGTSAPMMVSSKVRPLAFTTKKRSPYFPQIPTTAEAGGPEMDAGIWYGLWAPADTPKERVQYLQKEIQTALKSDKLKEVFKTQGATISDKPLAELPEFVSAEIQLWKRISESTGAQPK